MILKMINNSTTKVQELYAVFDSTEATRDDISKADLKLFLLLLVHSFNKIITYLLSL